MPIRLLSSGGSEPEQKLFVAKLLGGTSYVQSTETLHYIWPVRTRFGATISQQGVEPMAFPATCFYTAIRAIWPEDFLATGWTNLIEFLQDSDLNSETCRVYRWSDNGQIFSIRQINPDEGIPQVTNSFTNHRS